MVKKSSITIIFSICFILGYAGENRYIVFFTDKANTPFNIEEPNAYLSEKAIARRNKQGITISDQDLPVDPAFVSTISEYGVVWYTTKWFNAALVEMAPSEVDKVLELPFVSEVTFVAPSLETSRGRIKKDKKVKDTNQQSEIATLSSLNSEQNIMLGIDYMHNAGFKGEGMTIAVFDAGFPTVNTSSFFKHLIDRDGVKATYDFVRKEQNVYDHHSHGTRVLSTISAFKPDEYVGGAYNSDVVLCITEDNNSEYRIEEYNWLFAAEFADSVGVDIINSSLGYTNFDDMAMDYTHEDLDGKTAIISQAADIAYQKGMIVVSSAGNEGNDAWRFVTPPADAVDIFAVGSVDVNGIRSSFSSIGPTADDRNKPDVSALGSFTFVVNGETILNSNGTSFASPQIAALIAGVWQAFPDYSTEEVLKAIRGSGTKANAPDALVGYGVPNFTLLYLTLSTPETFEPNFIVYPNPVDGNSVFVLSNESEFAGNISLEFYSSEGKRIKRKEVANNLIGQPISVDISDLNPGRYILISKSKSLTNISRIVVL